MLGSKFCRKMEAETQNEVVSSNVVSESSRIRIVMVPTSEKFGRVREIGLRWRLDIRSASMAQCAEDQRFDQCNPAHAYITAASRANFLNRTSLIGVYQNEPT